MGFSAARPLVMRNPPWALWITIPLGLLDYSSARLLWTCCLLLILMFSADALWRLYAGEQRRWWVPLLLTFAFAPTLACISVGQTAPLVLAGLTLFLYLYPQSEFWCGFALLLGAVKPQLIFLFAVVLFLWSIRQKRTRIIAGAICGLTFVTAVAVFLDSSVILQYKAMLLQESVQTQFIPGLGGVLRMAFGSAWLQVLPAALGIVWVSFHYSRHQREWSWNEQLPVLILASILLSPYTWLVDEVVVLIALITVAAGLKNVRLSAKLGLTFALVNIIILTGLSIGIRVVSPYYVWTIWVWIGLYFVARAHATKSESAVRRVALPKSQALC